MLVLMDIVPDIYASPAFQERKTLFGFLENNRHYANRAIHARDFIAVFLLIGIMCIIAKNESYLINLG